MSKRTKRSGLLKKNSASALVSSVFPFPVPPIKSREATGTSEESFLGEDREWLLQFSRDTLKETHYHFFVFGHRHLPIDFRLSEESRYINLGEWINFDTYAEFDGKDLALKSWSGKDDKIYRKE
jgi:UDP-2,3-diacylglucosamine hydrolase